MTNEVMKIIEEKEKAKTSQSFHNWWSHNGYKVYRVILFPLWWGILAVQKINKILNNRVVWSEERTKSLLDYYIPRASDWDKENQCFWYYKNCGWPSPREKRHLRRKDRRYWQCHKYAIRDYLINTYEMNGFEKENSSCCGEIELVFNRKE